MFNIVYDGEPLSSTEDPTVSRINALTQRAFLAALPGQYLVDLFPWMKYLPDWTAKWKRDGKQRFIEDTQMFQNFLKNVKEKMVQYKISTVWAFLTQLYRKLLHISRVSVLIWFIQGIHMD